jgi:predicted transglutaminase-like cysteine proteinase
MFKKRCERLAAVLAVWIAVAGTANAQTAAGPMAARGAAKPPPGYADFCRRAPSECAVRGTEVPARLTHESWDELEQANLLGNLLIEPRSDLEQYGLPDVWSIPDSYGDCEDYVLLKRKWLIQRGWSTAALLVTVVFDESGDGHAVLLARTDRGDFILDNRSNSILPWHLSPYTFVKRQSSLHPSRWVGVAGPGDVRLELPTGRIAGHSN